MNFRRNMSIGNTEKNTLTDACIDTVDRNADFSFLERGYEQTISLVDAH